MSPVGGVGINLAVQDAVAAANILAAPLRGGTLRERDLAAVERGADPHPRDAADAGVHAEQSAAPGVGQPAAPAPPWPLRLIGRYPLLQRIPARLVGMGFRPEHVRLPAVDP